MDTMEQGNMPKRYLLFSALPLLVILGTLQAAFAQENINQEEELLSMYFAEDELVETATRSPKPISQVAENVTIISADEIAAMRVHTLGEVLNRQAGVFINFFGQDFLSDSALHLIGSQRHHALVLLDGVRLNLNSSGYAITNFIPLGIIKRIEIIKGAASSTWGSALGGVVNIITKDVGKSSTPSGTVHAGYGESQSSDISADAAGTVGKLGYYLHGGNIDSNGLALNRYSERNSAYGKFQLQLPYSSRLTVTAGYSDPNYKNLNWSDAWSIDDLNVYEDIEHQNTWSTIFFDTEFTNNLTLHLSGQHFDNSYTKTRHSLGTGLGGSMGSLLYEEKWEDEANSFTSRLTWAGESVTANLGFESSRTEMQFQSQLGSFFGGPSVTTQDPIAEERRGVYTNITYVNGKFSVTPGLRYDYHSKSEESVNPSLGLTYALTSDTLIRSSIAKGFSAPYLTASSNSPNLKPETTWTYQAGIESATFSHLRLKGTLFHQKIEDAWNDNVEPWINSGTIRLNGFEIEAKTAEYHGLSITSNFTFVTADSEGTGSANLDNDETYTGNLIFSYRCTDYGLRTELAGHYYWMDSGVKIEEPHDDDFLWDLLIGKDIVLVSLTGELYLKVHNIFNGSQYFDYEYPNPERWIEAGIALTF